MRRGLRHLLRDLAGRNDARFIELLCGQLACAVEAAEELHAAVHRGRDLDAAVDAVSEIEDRADRQRDELVDELAIALTTPLDREDIYRLSRSLDDIVDNLRDFVDALVLFEVADASPCAGSLETIKGGLGELRRAVELLGAGPMGQVTSVARSAKKATRVRQAYLAGLAAVFAGDDYVEMLKQRELLRRLDVVGLRFGEAADVLADAALKRA